MSEHNGRRKFNEIRQHMQIDEDEMQAISPTESQASSADGVFLAPSHRPSHPFRVIEPDGASVQSILSLGKVGRLLGSNPADPFIGLFNKLFIICLRFAEQKLFQEKSLLYGQLILNHPSHPHQSRVKTNQLVRVKR